jgi:hypothetical protein
VASARGLLVSGWLAVEPGELVNGCRGQVEGSIYSSLSDPQNSLFGGLLYDVIRYEEKPHCDSTLGLYSR